MDGAVKPSGRARSEEQTALEGTERELSQLLTKLETLDVVAVGPVVIADIVSSSPVRAEGVEISVSRAAST